MRSHKPNPRSLAPSTAAALAAAALAAALLVALVASVAVGHQRIAGAQEETAQRSGRITVVCGWRKYGKIDPIVSYGKESAHAHELAGGNVTPYSTRDRLLANGSTSCTVNGDRSGYWAPALNVGGKRVKPVTINAYYDAAPGVSGEAVRQFPPNWGVLAGHAHSGGPQKEVMFGCSKNATATLTPEPRDCAPDTTPTMRFVFPDCSDGRARSEDNYSHVAYSEGGACPQGTYPVLRLIVAVKYPMGTRNFSDARLSSGGTHTAHADMLDGWVRKSLTELVNKCIRTNKVCGIAETARIANSAQ